MRKIDKLYQQMIKNDELLKEFLSALVNGDIPEFFKKYDLDPRLSEVSELIERLHDKNSKYLQMLIEASNVAPPVNPPEDDPNEPVLPPPANPFTHTSDPREHLINYNEKFKDSKPILFRNEIVRQTLSCLIGKYKTNVLLIGAAGVGKTRIAEDIARMLAANDPVIPPQLQGYTVFELPISALVSGSGIVGSLEKKTRSVIDFASDINNKVILFIDEIHMIMSNRIYSTVAEILKPALARGSIKVIGATTLQEADVFMADPAFNRRFNRISVDELTKEQTAKILWSLRSSFRDHYGDIAIGKKVITEAVEAVDRYKIPGHRPDNAVTLLDRTIADALITPNGYNHDPILLTAQNVTDTAKRLSTGNENIENINTDELRKKLSVIKGQDDVVECIIGCIQRNNLDLFPRTRPLSLLFVGGTGTGKTETAKIIAQALTGSLPITINMTEFSEKSSISRIIGVHAGYVGYDEKTELPFDILGTNPRQVVLIDEFDKCNREIQGLFMNVLDNGSMQLANGKTVDFSKTIIIATTNVGCSNSNSIIGFNNEETSSMPSTKDLSSHFGSDLLNHFSKILYFRYISDQTYRDIVCDKYIQEVKRIKSMQKEFKSLPNTLPDDVVNRIVDETYNIAFGARTAYKAVRDYIETKMMEAQAN